MIDVIASPCVDDQIEKLEIIICEHMVFESWRLRISERQIILIETEQLWTGLEEMCQDTFPDNWEASVHVPLRTSTIWVLINDININPNHD